MAQTNLVGQTVLGYTVSEKINSGAFGTVYKVIKNNAAGQYVRALKHITIPTEKQYLSVLNSMGGDVSKANNYFSAMLDSIVSEIRILNDLSEKGVQHIVRYYENDISMVESPRRYDVYILMEYLTPLEDYIMSHSFTVRDVLNLAFDVLQGLNACHQNGVIHRDIKDDNIFVSDNGGYKIGDFGVSKVLKDSTKAESLKGTPNFLAPEVYLGKEGYTMSVDLYSLGIVLYRLLNYGRNPFLPKFPAQYFSQDEDRAFEERMTGKTPEMPLLGGDKIGAVIVKAISKSSERYQTASEFYMDLRNAVSATDESCMNVNVKIEMTGTQGTISEETSLIYGETIGETIDSTSSQKKKTLDDRSSPSINKHLFDSIGDTPIIPETQSDNVQTSAKVQENMTHVESNREPVGRQRNRVVDRVPVVEEPQVTEVVDRKVARKAVFVTPFIVIAIGIIAYFIVIPNIYGQVVSFIDWLVSDPQNIIDTLRDPNVAFGKANYIIAIRVFWYVWLAALITSLFFVGKEFQKKPEPNAINAILVKKEPYILAQDIMAALKEEALNNKTKELNAFMIAFKRIEEKLSVESDFGIGRDIIIDCENNIALQLQYILDSVPYISSGDVAGNIAELNKAITNINSLLRKRTELKRK